jgi:hypothetical protein
MKMNRSAHMSGETLAIALHHSRAEGTALLVLIGIANHDGDGGAWPKIATLAKYARVKDRAVTNAIATLVKLGEIRVHHNAGGTRTTDDRYRPNLYEFLLSCPSTCKGDKNHTPVDKRDSGVHGGAPLDSSGVHGGTGPGVHHGAPPYEPSFLNRPFGGTLLSHQRDLWISPPPRGRCRGRRGVSITSWTSSRRTAGGARTLGSPSSSSRLRSRTVRWPRASTSASRPPARSARVGAWPTSRRSGDDLVLEDVGRLWVAGVRGRGLAEPGRGARLEATRWAAGAVPGAPRRCS